MPAPDLATLFNYEDAIEDVLVAHFKSTQTAWQVLTARTSPVEQKKLKTPRLEVRVQVASSGVQENQCPADGKWYKSHKIGTLTVRAIAQRGTAGQDLGRMCGFVRATLEPFARVFTAQNLPYYEIARLDEASSTPSIVVENDEIFKELGFALEWWVRPDAFPVS